MKLIEIWISCPSQEVAGKLGGELVEKRLVACANIFDAVRSIYRWQDKIEHETEVALVLKTRDAYFEKVAEFVNASHPYDIPAIVAVPIVHVNKPYADWLIDSTEPDA